MSLQLRPIGGSLEEHAADVDGDEFAETIQDSECVEAVGGGGG